MSARPWNCLALIVLTGLAAGCAAPALNYVPAPLEQPLFLMGDAQPAGHMLLAVIGLAGEQDELLQMRLRLDNAGDSGLRLDAGSLQLLTSDLQPFGPVRIAPDVPGEIPPGESRTCELFFPLPAGTEASGKSLSSLTLRWRVHQGDRTADLSSSFQRTQSRERPAWHTVFSVGVRL